MNENSHADFFDNIEILFTGDQIQRRVKELAVDVSQAYAGQDLVIVPILRGSVLFAMDLLRHLTLYPELDFISASSYGSALKSSGRVTIKLVSDLDIRNKHVLIVEDIVDTGRTLNNIIAYLGNREPASLRCISMFYKELADGSSAAPPDWFGYIIPDVFVVGYGLDYQQRFRNLPYIAKLL